METNESILKLLTIPVKDFVCDAAIKDVFDMDELAAVLEKRGVEKELNENEKLGDFLKEIENGRNHSHIRH